MPDTYDAPATSGGPGQDFDAILDTIGDTPLVRLPHLSAQINRRARSSPSWSSSKNPLGSVKDRIGVAMIEWLEATGHLKPGGTIVEPDQRQHRHRAGLVASAKGYPACWSMPESMSMERRKMLLILGARLELTPAEKGMRGAVARAQERWRGAFRVRSMPQQFENQATR